MILGPALAAGRAYSVFLRGLRDSVLRSVASVRSVSSLAQTPKMSRLSEGPYKNVALDREAHE